MYSELDSPMRLGEEVTKQSWKLFCSCRRGNRLALVREKDFGGPMKLGFFN
jgi:hypothetical protein